MSDEIVQVRTAATLGFLDDLPEAYLTRENFLLQDDHGWNAVHFACESGNLHQVPEEFITEAVLLTCTKDGKTALHLVSEFDLLPLEILKPANLVLKSTEGRTPLHRAASFGTLYQLPSELLTREILTASDDCGRTIYHAAANHNCLDQLPGVTLEDLLLPDLEGETPLHVLMQRPSLPPEVLNLFDNLTAESILVRNNLGLTPLHYASSGILGQLPKSFLTAKSVLQQDNFETSPLDNWIEWRCTDSLLGIEFGDSPELREKLGEAWWNKNQLLLEQRVGLSNCDEQNEIDIF